MEQKPCSWLVSTYPNTQAKTAASLYPFSPLTPKWIHPLHSLQPLPHISSSSCLSWNVAPASCLISYTISFLHGAPEKAPTPELGYFFPAKKHWFFFPLSLQGQVDALSGYMEPLTIWLQPSQLYSYPLKYSYSSRIDFLLFLFQPHSFLMLLCSSHPVLPHQYYAPDKAHVVFWTHCTVLTQHFVAGTFTVELYFLYHVIWIHHHAHFLH